MNPAGQLPVGLLAVIPSPETLLRGVSCTVWLSQSRSWRLNVVLGYLTSRIRLDDLSAVEIAQVNQWANNAVHAVDQHCYRSEVARLRWERMRRIFMPSPVFQFSPPVISYGSRTQIPVYSLDGKPVFLPTEQTLAPFATRQFAVPTEQQVAPAAPVEPIAFAKAAGQITMEMTPLRLQLMLRALGYDRFVFRQDLDATMSLSAQGADDLRIERARFIADNQVEIDAEARGATTDRERLDAAYRVLERHASRLPAAQRAWEDDLVFTEEEAALNVPQLDTTQGKPPVQPVSQADPWVGVLSSAIGVTGEAIVAGINQGNAVQLAEINARTQQRLAEIQAAIAQTTSMSQQATLRAQLQQLQQAITTLAIARQGSPRPTNTLLLVGIGLAALVAVVFLMRPRNNPRRRSGGLPAPKGGARIVYSPVNQAWFLMWHSQVLRVFTRKQDAIDEFRRITSGVQRENPRRRESATVLFNPTTGYVRRPARGDYALSSEVYIRLVPTGRDDWIISVGPENVGSFRAYGNRLIPERNFGSFSTAESARIANRFIDVLWTDPDARITSGVLLTKDR